MKKTYIKPTVKVIGAPELMYSGLEGYSSAGEDGVWAVRRRTTVDGDSDDDGWCEDPMVKSEFEWSIEGL